MNQAFHHVIKISGFDSQLLLDVASDPDVLRLFIVSPGQRSSMSQPSL